MMIIDTHTHFYDPSRPQGVPWPPPDNAALYRTVLPDDFLAAARPVGVQSTVVVEASPWPDDNQWILDLADTHACIAGFIGNLNPTDDAFVDRLSRYAEHPLFRGLRVGGGIVGQWNTQPIRGNLERLADADLALDLLIRPSQMNAAADLANALLGLTIVIDHTGHANPTDDTLDADWLTGMDALAAAPNVACKLSGMPENTKARPAPTNPAVYSEVVDALLERFGADRLMFGSNWPVCEPAASYTDVVRITQALVESKAADNAAAIFANNAMRIYGLDPARVADAR